MTHKDLQADFADARSVGLNDLILGSLLAYLFLAGAVKKAYSVESGEETWVGHIEKSKRNIRISLVYELAYMMHELDGASEFDSNSNSVTHEHTRIPILDWRKDLVLKMKVKSPSVLVANGLRLQMSHQMTSHLYTTTCVRSAKSRILACLAILPLSLQGLHLLLPMIT